MATTMSTSTGVAETIADLLDRLGGIPASRVRLHPAPGTAREEDVVRVHAHEGRLCELVDGVLVEKAMGYFESRLAMVLGHLIQMFLDRVPLGIVAGEAGMMRITQRQVRIPDVSFVSWDRLPGGRVPREPIPDLVPDLAVEILSEGNTVAEMKRKVAEYFAAGTRLVWIVHPDARAVEVFRAPGRSVRVGAAGTLQGGKVLPGFSLSVRDWFDRAGTKPPRA